MLSLSSRVRHGRQVDALECLAFGEVLGLMLLDLSHGSLQDFLQFEHVFLGDRVPIAGGQESHQHNYSDDHHNEGPCVLLAERIASFMSRGLDAVPDGQVSVWIVIHCTVDSLRHTTERSTIVSHLACLAVLSAALVKQLLRERLIEQLLASIDETWCMPLDHGHVPVE